MLEHCSCFNLLFSKMN
uniref:Uncharacterized protein n=1 Tax=Anguilla anguilla TaxID=7936 RepID=A0A0E9Q1H1_ANGAN